MAPGSSLRGSSLMNAEMEASQSKAEAPNSSKQTERFKAIFPTFCSIKKTLQNLVGNNPDSKAFPGTEGRHHLCAHIHGDDGSKQHLRVPQMSLSHQGEIKHCSQPGSKLLWSPLCKDPQKRNYACFRYPFSFTSCYTYARWRVSATRCVCTADWMMLYITSA